MLILLSCCRSIHFVPSENHLHFAVIPACDNKGTVAQYNTKNAKVLIFMRERARSMFGSLFVSGETSFRSIY